MARTDNEQGSLLFYLSLLTLFLILLEISFFIQCNKIYLSDFQLVHRQLSLPIFILPSLILFLFAHCVLHIIFCLQAWFITCKLSQILRFNSNPTLFLGIIIWALSFLLVLLANYFFYPESKFSELMDGLLNRNAIYYWFFNFLFFIYCVLAGATLWLACKPHLKNILGVICLISLFYFPAKFFFIQKAPVKVTLPNVFIIGIDSIRPNFLSFMGGDINTSFMDNLLRDSVVFPETITPLARTFPAWAAILTGLNPKTTGIRHDLSDTNQLDKSKTLASILKNKGYYTVFATDEVRFSNIDTHFGFEAIISPPMGINDFLIGTFNDFPLANLIQNTKLGAWLFPYSYANRAVHFSYDPDSFIQRLQYALDGIKERPLFMAVHFCLPHTPYTWGTKDFKGFNALERYRLAVERADRQVAAFYQVLKNEGLLERAIVVLLSDHGEGLELPGDRLTEAELYLRKPNIAPKFYPPVLDNEAINQSAGHGTDVLGLNQYHSLLAFKLNGLSQQQGFLVPGRVSLIDVKPTILDLLDMRYGEEDGISLRSQILGQKLKVENDRHLFLESDYSPQAMRTVYPNLRKVYLEGIQMFEINPQSLRLAVKPTMSHMITESKQRADIYRHWILALYPQAKDIFMPILVDLETGEWTEDLNSSFAKHSPAKKMLQTMRNYYGDEMMNFNFNVINHS